MQYPEVKGREYRGKPPGRWAYTDEYDEKLL